MFGEKLSRYRREFSEGDILFEEDDWGKFLIVVDEGNIHIEKNRNGSRQTVAEIGSGGMVGEMVLAGDDYHRSATARAATDVSGWKFNEDQIDHLLAENETFRNKLFATLTGRLRRSTDNVAEFLEIKDRQIRVMLLLLSLLEEDDFFNTESMQATVNLTPEFFADRFDTSYEVIDSIFESHSGGAIGNVELEDLRTHRKVAERFLSDFLEDLDVNVPVTLRNESEIREKTLEYLRTLRKALEKIEDEDTDFSRHQFKELREDRATMEKLHEQYKELETGDHLSEEIQKTINAVDHQLKKFDPDDFGD